MTAANLALRFLLEIAMLVALGWTGAELGPGTAGSIGLAVALPLVAATVWAVWVAPKAERRLADPARLGLELLLFAAAAAGLVATGHPVLGAALFAVALVNATVLRRLGSEH